MTDWFGAVSAFAQIISVRQDGELRYGSAFIQPLSVTNPERELSPAPAGILDGRRYLLIAWPGAFKHGGRGAVIECGERKYEVMRCEKMGGGSHWEGLMRLLAGDCNDA